MFKLFKKIKGDVKEIKGMMDESTRITKELTEDIKRDNKKFEEGIIPILTAHDFVVSDYITEHLTDDEVETLFDLLQKCKYDGRFSAKVKEFDDWCITREAIHITCSKTIKLCEELKNNREKRSDV